VISCASWYGADLASGNHYSHPAIPVWNALIRFGFFIITGLLIATLRENIRIQERLALTDSLTGLCTRRAFDERFQHDLAIAKREQGVMTVAYLDLDNFKSLNDSSGHAEGDNLLRELGKVLLQSVREADSVARLGGDEFALILPQTDQQGAELTISKIKAELDKIFTGRRASVGCSISVVTFESPTSLSAEDALIAADKLMYRVKHSGKGAIAFHNVGEPSDRGL
jgi:diguanylate cyclase (GGDEF)-like protein